MTIPEASAPAVTRVGGRTPVTATVDGRTWRTSVWGGKDGRSLLPVPKQKGPGKEHGDVVTVRLVVDDERA